MLILQGPYPVGQHRKSQVEGHSMFQEATEGANRCLWLKRADPQLLAGTSLASPGWVSWLHEAVFSETRNTQWPQVTTLMMHPSTSWRRSPNSVCVCEGDRKKSVELIVSRQYIRNWWWTLEDIRGLGTTKIMSRIYWIIWSPSIGHESKQHLQDFTHLHLAEMWQLRF